MNADEMIIAAESLKNTLVARATGGATSETEFRKVRGLLINEPGLQGRIPKCVQTARTLDEFWGLIKPKFAHYHERREFIRQEFDSLLTWLERGAISPVEDGGTIALTKMELPDLHDAWRNALERRRTGDIDGAITAARMLVETVCKHLLDDFDIDYADDADLPKLYRLVAEKVNMAPSQHTEQVIRQILGGCTAAVEGLGALRNRLSDAHGRGKVAPRAAMRHAELAVNLAGTVATILVATWESTRKPSGTASSTKP